MLRLPDTLLLEKLKGGDPRAFDALYLKYYKLLVANAYFLLKDDQEAKDLAQDFLFEFWHKRLYLRLEGDIKGYLYRSIYNKCLNLKRKQTLQHQKQVFLMQEEPSFEENEGRREQDYELLQIAIDDLPPQRREILQRIYFEEKKYQEAADEMGISLNTLKTHLKIALKNLRNQLKKD
jgi:RNA polymerase sigma-70 factor (family 1)